MDVISAEETSGLKTGDIVAVRRGKQAGSYFVVVRTEGDSRVYISDGAFYRADCPKKKNVKHLQRTSMNLEDVAGRIASGKVLDNGWLAEKLARALKQRGAASQKQGG